MHVSFHRFRVFWDLINPEAPTDGWHTVGLRKPLPATQAAVACNYFPCLQDKQTLVPPTRYTKPGLANDDKPM